MAINNQRYETVYGSALFDELHNFFPELMYDEVIFSTEPFAWMRHRMTTLFPQGFTRQRSLYNIYNAAPRRADYETWRFSSFPAVGRTQGNPRFSNPLRVTTSLVEPVVRAPAARAAVRTTPATRAQDDFTLLTNLLNSALSPTDNLTAGRGDNNILRFLYGTVLPPMEDVLVTPSAEIVTQHSELLQSTAVPADVNCVICQERNTNIIEWRKLNCSHSFHRNCIDQWFQQDSHCPVCRHDIRTPFSTATPTPATN